MKIKWNWGTGIVVAMVLFMIFILQFVYRVTFVDKYDHHLVSDDYYKDELHYQKEIDKLNKAFELDENVNFLNTPEGLLIKFPTEFEGKKIEGNIFFIRLSNEKLDFTEEIILKEHAMTVSKDKLLPGKWEIRIEWKYKDQDYLTKESLFAN